MTRIKGFYKTLAIIALPIILQNLLQTFVNMLDTVMVGKLGSVEIASVGLGNQIFFILNMMLFGINSGASIFTAQFWGKKDMDGLRHTLGIALVLSFGISLLFFLGSQFIPSLLIGIYSKDPAVIRLGSSYLRIVGWSYPFMAVTFAFQLSMRSTEHVNLPMISTSVAFLVNAVLNYLLIFGIGFFPVLGINGAAFATIASRLVEFFMTIIWAYSHHYESCSSIRKMLGFDSSFFGKYFKIALPVIINESLWGLGISAQNAIFSRTGTDAIAAFNITGTISQLTWVFFIGVGNAAAIIIGKNIGSGDEKLARAYARKFCIFMPVMAVFIGALLYPLSFLLPYLFNVDGEILRQSRLMLYVLMCFYPSNAFNMCFIVGVCRSGGDTVYAAVNDILWLWVLAIPLGGLAAFVLQLEPYQIYLCLFTEQIVKCIAGIIRVSSGKWLHNVTR